MRGKIFTADYSSLERRIQEWLDANPNITIEHVTQSQGPVLINVTIFYTESTYTAGIR